MKRVTKKLFRSSILLFSVGLIVMLLIPCNFTTVEAISNDEITSKISSLQGTMDGYYWNAGKSESELISAINRGDYSFGLTGSACSLSSANDASHHLTQYGCTSNTFNGSRQCAGFAEYMGYAIFGSKVSTSNGWTKYTSSSGITLEPGDIIRYSGHSAMVWYTSGDTLYVAEANWWDNQKRWCQVHFGKSWSSVSQVKSNLTYIWKHPANVTPSTPTSPPTGAWIWSDKTVAAVGEEIAFNYNATGAVNFFVGVNKEGVGRVRTVDVGTSDWYRTSFSEPGTYTIYAMCCNSAGHMDSNYITFTIVSPEKSRSVAGDFNGDGLDDYATLFDYGNGRIQWHVFLSTGSGFSEEIWRESLSDYGYYASCTSGRVAAGDFDGDGKDDVALMYDYSTGSEIHVFLSTGSSFKSWQSWYSDRTSYKSSHVTGRFVAGDFNEDGKDDIATMYDYTDGSEIHVFLSTGSSFKGWQSWYSDKTSYKPSCIDDRMVAGDFNGDGKDDIATMYAYDTYNTHMHVFLSTGTSFKGWDTWYKDTTSYSVNCVNGRMTAGDFNGDGKDDIATMYDYGDSKCEMHVFLSNGKKFEGWYDWCEDTSFSANAVTSRFVAGDFNGDGRYDVATMYDYDRTYVIFHMYISEGTEFNHEWWNKIDNYNANRISNTVEYSDSYSATFKFTKKDITPTAKPTAKPTPIATAKPTPIATAIPTAKPTPTVKPTVTLTPTETPYDGLAVTAKKVTAKAGSEVEIPISISKNPGIAGFKFKISYDKSVLIPISITKGSAFGNGTLNSNINQGGDLSNLDEVTAYWSNPSNVSDDGEMFTVKFKVSDNATDGTYPITLTYEDGDITNQTFDNINPKIINGAVTLTKVKKGDIYEDGVVNTKDGVLLSQYLAKWNINFTENQMTAADVYEDGVVNTKDGVKLSQVLAKWDNVTLSSEISASADGIAVSIPNIDTNAGEYIDVPVTLSKNSGIAGFNFNINYDTSALTPVSITAGDILSDGTFTSNLLQDSDLSHLEYVTAYWNNPSNITDNGTLFTIRFKVNENANGTLPITVTYNDGDICNQEFENVNVDITNGAINVSASVAGKYYEIASAKITNVAGEEVDTIPQNGNFTVNATINELAKYSGNAKLYCVLYDDNDLLVSITNADISDKTNYEFAIPNINKNIAKIKLFVWNTFSGMKPLSDCVAIE